MAWIVDLAIHELCHDKYNDSTHQIEEIRKMIRIGLATIRTIPWIVGWLISGSYYYGFMRIVLVEFGIKKGITIIFAMSFAISVVLFLIHDYFKLDIFSIHKLKTKNKKWYAKVPTTLRLPLNMVFFVLITITQSPPVTTLYFRKDGCKGIGLAELLLLIASSAYASIHWTFAHRYIFNEAFHLIGMPRI